MFHTKLTLVALLTLGLVACTKDKPKDETADTPETATKVATAPAAAAPAKHAEHQAGGTEDNYNCEGAGQAHECEGADKEHEGGGCNQWDDAASEVTKRKVTDDAVWVSFDVDGMTCGGCERRIQAKVGELDGVVAVEASSELSRVRIAFSKGAENETAARERIASLGYKVR
jgi:copper chaperone CopZ